MVTLHRFIEWSIVLLQAAGVTLINLLTSLASPRLLWMRLQIIFDSKLTPASALEYAARWHKGKVLLIPDRPIGYDVLPKDKLTMEDIHTFINRVSNVFRDVVRINRYDRVLVWKSNSPDYFLICNGIIRAGGVAVPVNPGMVKESLANYLRHTGSKVLVTDAETLARHGVTESDFDMVEQLVLATVPQNFMRPHIDLNTAVSRVSTEFTPVVLHGDSDVMLVHTSGTTGFPKAVISTSNSFIAAIKSDAKRHLLTPDNRVLTAAPFNHAFSQILCLLCMLAGAPLYTMTEPDGETALRTIDDKKITIFAAFSVMYLRMYRAGLDRFSLATVTAWLSVADAAHEVHMRAFASKGAMLKIGPFRLLSSFFLDGLGSSEVGTSGTRRYVSSRTNTFGRNIGRQELFGPRVKCADEMGRRVKPGTIGRMYTKGPTLFKGYWNAHERNHGTVMDGWWWTGDLVYQDWTGSYYHLDRDADTIRTKNGPTYTLMVEEVALNNKTVGEAACFAVPDLDGKEQAIVAVYPQPNGTLDTAEVLAWINAQLKIGAPVAHVFQVKPEDVPLGLTGKVLKRELRRLYRDYLAREGRAPAAPVVVRQKEEARA